jgi:peptidoglycan endopeptidase LytE
LYKNQVSLSEEIWSIASRVNFMTSGKSGNILLEKRRELMKRDRHFPAIGLALLLLLLGVNQKGFAEERYRVKGGDNLYGISKRFDVPIETLKKVNHLGKDRIRLNQVLLIPDRKERQKVAPAKKVSGKTPKKFVAEQESYVVCKGDNLFSISKRVGFSVEEIKKTNHLTVGTLRVGQVLTLPKVRMEEDVEEDIEEQGDSEEPVAEPNEQNGEEETSKAVGKWSNSEERNLLIRVVKTFLGVPYRLGGATLKGIDCSAFVKKIYQIFSIDLPRTTREQLHFGKGVEKSELEEGDLVFFRTRRANGTHVGIYIGNNQFVHASSLKKEVKVDNLDAPYYNKHFLRGVRVKEFGKEI